MSSDSYDSSDLIEASPEKTLSSSIWCESRIGIQCKRLGNSSKKSEESIGDNKFYNASRRSAEETETVPMKFDKHCYRDRQELESSDSDEEEDINKQGAKSDSDEEEDINKQGAESESDEEEDINKQGAESESDEEVVVTENKVIKSARSHRNRLISDSDSEQNMSNTDMHTKWRKKPLISSDSESNHSASNADSENEDADSENEYVHDASNYESPPIVEKCNKVPETPFAPQGNQSVSEKSHADDTAGILELSDADSRNELNGNVSKKRISKVTEKSNADGLDQILDLSDTGALSELNGNVNKKRISKVTEKSNADDSDQILDLSDTGALSKLNGNVNKKRISKVTKKSNADDSGEILDLSDTGALSELNGNVNKKRISKVTKKSGADDTGEILDLSDTGALSGLNGNVSKKRISKSKSPVASDIQYINSDTSGECICIDDTPVKKHSLDRLKKRSNDFGLKKSPPNRNENKQGSTGKYPEATLSGLTDRVKAASLTVGAQQSSGFHFKEKTTQQQYAKHNEHELPVFVLGKKLENVTLTEKRNSDLSGHPRKKELKMKIDMATQNVARLKRTLMNTNLNVLPDRGQRLKLNLVDEETKLKKLNEEYQVLLREYPPEKVEKQQEIRNPFQTMRNATAQQLTLPEENRRVVPNPFQAAIQAASQQKMNAGNEKKPSSFLGSMPTTIGMGQKALETYRAEKAMTVDTLKQLHKSMETCPSEDTLEEDPKLLKSSVTLMPHQKRALAWLLWREASKPHGGILADDMGLGKTLTMISLVLKVKELAESKAEEENERESESDDDHESSWYASKRKWEKGGTLVVCPASLINQWESEVKNRCKKGALDVEVFHGSSRESKPRRLARRDMVITTYNIVRSEGAVVTGKRGAGDSYDYTRQGPLFGVKWERVILDEAHQIRNHKSQTSVAACGLRAKYRWALTGTPMHNKDLDLYSLLKFLKCAPFDDLSIWRHWVGNKSAGGMQRLNTVINSLMLRRTKEQLHSKGALGSLSEKHIHQITVKLDKEEFEVYDTVLSLSRSVFQMFLEQRTEKALAQWEDKKGVNVQRPDNPYEMNDELKGLHQRMTNMQDIKTYEILVLLLRLRQICCLPGLIKSMLDEESCQNDTIEDDEGMDIDLMSKLNMLGLEDKENETSEPLNADKVVKKKVLVVDNPVFDLKRMSSKMQRLFKILEEKILPTGDNVVIVSQWSTLLEIMKGHLQKQGVKCLILTGAVPVKDRMAIVDTFNAPSKTSIVLLLSLTAGGVGLNLIGGNHLLLFDIHWNPQLESQAFDRIYRVGQTKTVHIYKFICDDTIEQRILSLQNKKLQLADSILTGVRNKQASKLTLDDLKMLFNLHAT